LLNMDTDLSFRIAAKHLFRHLHDPVALRHNSLVRHFFDNPRIALADRNRANEALNRIHGLVRVAAEHCRDTDSASGRSDQAQRQFTIVVDQCLGRHKLEQVAKSLSLSPRQCYRERANVCFRIAQYIREQNDASTLNILDELDAFQFLMDRAMRRASIDDAEATFDEYDRLLALAPTPGKRMEVLRASAFASLEFGDVSRAQQAYAAALDLEAECRTSCERGANISKACVDLIASKLAHHRADTGNALAFARQAEEHLRSAQVSARGYRAELYVESLYELGTALCNSGSFDQGYDVIADAESRLPNLRITSSRLGTKVTVAIWKLRNYLLMSSKSWYPSYQRLKGLAAAIEQAYASGSIPEATTALDALTEHYALCRQDGDALRAARLTISIAKQQSSIRLSSQVSIRVALKLLSTQYWDEALKLLPDGAALARCDAYHRELVTYFFAERALKLRQFGEAWTLAHKEDERAEYAALTVSRRLIAALAAHELGRPTDARSLIEAVIPTAEQLGSVPTLRDAYFVAARVMRDPAFRRRANDLTRLLTA
jgi:hypothetical protein